MSFVGVGGVGAALFRLSLNWPGNVFHKPTVEHALQELKEKYGLVNITYRVRDLGESQITPFGSTSYRTADDLKQFCESAGRKYLAP